MSDSFPTSTISPQRRHIALAAVAGVAVVMVFAFFSGGGSNSDPLPEVEVADTPIQVDENYGVFQPDQALNGEDWINVGNPTAGQGASSPAPAGTNPASPVALGDPPPIISAPPVSSGSPAPAVPASSASHAAQPQPVSKVSEPTHAAVQPPATASKIAAKPSPPPAVGATASIPRQQRPVSAVPAAKTLPPRQPEPEFVKPAIPKTGLIAQSRRLITEDQFQHSQPQAAKPPVKVGQPPAASIPKSNPTVAPQPAKVLQQQAREFARRTTEKMHQQGQLKPQQKVRLPKVSETTNPKIWREDEAPVSTDERRPFGLIVADDNPTTTPEGIPQRTDIPVGTSPLQKTGPDKPLWKRPE